MNVLQLLPSLNVGGVEKSTIEMTRYLEANGHKSIVVSKGGKLVRDLTACGARHYELPIGRKDPSAIYSCYKKLKIIIENEKIDVVHARSRVPAIAGYFAARSTGRTFITTAHGHYKAHLISYVMGWGKIVIVASEMMARHMKDTFGVPPGKLAIVPRGVDLEKFSYIPRSDRSGKPLRIGMICRYTPLKGHLDFLKALSYVYRKIPNIEAVMMGDLASANPEYIKKLEMTINRLQLDKIVKISDSDRDTADVLGGLDIFVSANSQQEAFGRTVIEAQARGVPVVATRVGGVAENIEDRVTGLLSDPEDAQDIAEKMLRIARDRELAFRISTDARKKVEERFSLNKVLEMELNVYREAIASKSILVFKISSLGDIILSVPSLRALKEKYPDHKLKLLVDVKFRGVLAGCPYIDEIISCDLNGRDRGRGFLRLAGRLRSEDFDISVDLQNNKKSHLLAFLGFIPDKYGFANGKWSALINRKALPPKKAIDPISHQHCVLKLAGINRMEKRLELWPSEEGLAWVDRFFKDNWLQPGQKTVAFSLAASARWKSKNWGIQPMLELADILARRKGIRVVLIGASGEDRLALDFMRMSTAKPMNAVGRTGLPELIGLTKKCDALVTGDS
ncbi:MAG: glycosyltransferase, partial [Candidatus Omnitrophica bacterium]|nr:glycosyltransferase [Candidatus Omnitrophota bacterium]